MQPGGCARPSSNSIQRSSSFPRKSGGELTDDDVAIMLAQHVFDGAVRVPVYGRLDVLRFVEDWLHLSLQYGPCTSRSCEVGGMICQDHQDFCAGHFLIGRAKAFPVGINRRLAAFIKGGMYRGGLSGYRCAASKYYCRAGYRLHQEGLPYLAVIWY